MSSRSRSKKRQQRARMARTNGDLLVGGAIPSGQDPSLVWWWGDDRIQTPGNGSLAAVTRATGLIVNTISALPWRLLSGGLSPQTSIIELPPPRWLTDPMLHRPDARFGPSPTPSALRLPRSAFWGQFMRSALMKGCGHLLFEEDSTGAPVAGTLRVLNPDMVATQDRPYVHRRLGSEDGGYIDTDYDGRLEIGGRIYRLVEMLNPYGWVDEYGCTLGVLEKHAVEYGVALQQTEYASGMYRSGVPSGYLKVSVPNYSKDQADALKAAWMAAHGGDRRSIAVLNATTEFTPLQMSPVDMALIESRKMSLIDISNAFGVPVYMLGGGDSAGLTYSNAESRNKDFMQYSLLPWANSLENVLTSLVPQGQYIEVSFEGVLRADTATRYGAYSTAIKDGWITVDEVRLIEGLPPLDEARPLGGLDPSVPSDTQPAIEEAPQ